MKVLIARVLPLIAVASIAGCAPSMPTKVAVPLDGHYLGALQNHFGIPSERSPSKAVRGLLGVSWTASESGQPRIAKVEKDLPADRAGLREGDVVLQMNGAPASKAALMRQVARQPGKPLRLLISRDGFTREFHIAPVASSSLGPCVVADASASEYRGDCANGLAHGKGRFFTPDHVYVGELREGLPHGQGQQISKAGTYYEGAFRDGSFWGRGLQVYHQDGRKFEGEWKEGKLDGPAVFTAADGRTYKGVWTRGANPELERQLREEREAREMAQREEQRQKEEERSDNFLAFMQGVLQVAGMAAEIQNERLQAKSDQALLRQQMTARQAQIEADSQARANAARANDLQRRSEAERRGQAADQQRRPVEPNVAQLTKAQGDREVRIQEQEAARKREQAAADQMRAREEAAAERRQARELAEQQAKQRRADYLNEVMQATSLTVASCQGKPVLKGAVPRIRPQEVACLRLDYEVSCGSGSPAFESGHTNNWVGYSCLGLGDVKFIRNPERCAPEQMRVTVTSMDSCG